MPSQIRLDLCVSDLSQGLHRRAILLFAVLVALSLGGCSKPSTVNIAEAADGPGTLKQDAGAAVDSSKPAAAAQLEHPFPQRTPAPALDSGQEWLNAAGPVDLKDL